MNNHKPLNNGVKTLLSIGKWITPIIGFVVAALLVWFGQAVVSGKGELKAFQATYKSDQAAYRSDLKSMADDRAIMKEGVAANTKWIREWYDTLRVPERDQRQDSAIATLESAVSELKIRLRETERQYAQLGGPNDPLYKEIERLQRQIERLSDSR